MQSIAILYYLRFLPSTFSSNSVRCSMILSSILIEYVPVVLWSVFCIVPFSVFLNQEWNRLTTNIVSTSESMLYWCQMFHAKFFRSVCFSFFFSIFTDTQFTMSLYFTSNLTVSSIWKSSSSLNPCGRKMRRVYLRIFQVCPSLAFL